MKRRRAGAGRGWLPILVGFALLIGLTPNYHAQAIADDFWLSDQIENEIQEADEVFAQRMSRLLDERNARIAEIVETAMNERLAELERRLAEKELELALKDRQIAELQSQLDELALRDEAAKDEEPLAESEPIAEEEPADVETVAEAELTTPTDAFLGVDHVDSEDGALVVRVLEGTPASTHGIEIGDCILTVGSESVTSETLGRAITSHSPGEWVKVNVLRDGEELALWLALMDRDDFQEDEALASETIEEIFEEVPDEDALPEESTEEMESYPTASIGEGESTDDYGESDELYGQESYDSRYYDSEYGYEYPYESEYTYEEASDAVMEEEAQGSVADSGDVPENDDPLNEEACVPDESAVSSEQISEATAEEDISDVVAEEDEFVEAEPLPATATEPVEVEPTAAEVDEPTEESADLSEEGEETAGEEPLDNADAYPHGYIPEE